MENNAPATPQKKPGIRWGRLIFRLVLAGAALLILAVVAAFLLLPGIVKTQVESIGSKATGATVKVGSVDLSIFGGSLYLNDFSISAPAGYASKELIAWKRAGASVSLGSLRTDTIVVPRIAVDGLRVNLDVDSKGNQSLKSFLDKMKQISDEAAKAQTSEQKTAPKTILPSIRINAIVATDTQIQMNDEFAGDKPLDSSITVGSAQLANIYMPAAYLNNPQGFTDMTPNITRLTMSDLSLKSPTDFSKPEFLSNKTFVLALDTGTLLGSVNLPVIIIDELKAANTNMLAEVRDKGAGPMPQNIQQFQVISMNTTIPNGAPQKFPPLATPEAEEKKADKPFFTSIGDTFGTATELANAEPPATVEPTEPPLPSTFKSLELKNMEFSALNIENIDKTNPDKNLVLRGGTVFASNITYPYSPGTEGNFRISAQPRTEQALFTSEIKGGLTDLSAQRILKITANGRDLPLKGIGKVSDGFLTFNLDADVRDEAVFGTVGIKVEQFNMANATMTEQLTIVKPLQALSAAGAPEIVVPFRSQLSRGSNISQIFQQIGNAVVLSLLKQVMNAFDPTTNAAKDVADRARKEAEKAQSTINDVLKGNKTIDEGVKSATDSVNSIADEVNNLFGGSKKKDEKKK